MNRTELYNRELIKAMNWLGQQPNTLFVGQAVRYAGTGMFNSLIDIADEQKLEFPITENFQMGYCTGLALNGYVPIAIYPRWNFLLCAADQIVNHLDKLHSMSSGKVDPKVIIRVAVGTEIPVDPQDQHRGNFAQAFANMCQHINIVELKHSDDIVDAYKYAYTRKGSTILVEFPDYGKTENTNNWR
jgi:pyruvate/2-oxoglutarate/acetoin dehydrogenase E1 component